jgi:hypothetical protein
LQRQREFQRQADSRVKQNLDKLAQSTPEDERQTLASQIRQQLRTKQALALAGIQPTGGSDAVTEYAERAAPTAVGYGDFIGENRAATDAPLYQRQGEAFDRADVGSFVDYMRRNSAQEDALLRLQLAGIRPNPWASAIAAGLGAYSQSGGGMFGANTGGGGGTPLANLGGQSAQTYYGNMPANNMFAPFTRGSLYAPAPTRRGSGIGMFLGGP